MTTQTAHLRRHSLPLGGRNLRDAFLLRSFRTTLCKDRGPVQTRKLLFPIREVVEFIDGKINGGPLALQAMGHLELHGGTKISDSDEDRMPIRRGPDTVDGPSINSGLAVREVLTGAIRTRPPILPRIHEILGDVTHLDWIKPLGELKQHAVAKNLGVNRQAVVRGDGSHPA